LINAGLKWCRANAAPAADDCKQKANGKFRSPS
jgi:hypothetical protein